MIFYREWKVFKKNPSNGWNTNEYYLFKGWFLFGFIPLFIMRNGV